MQDYNDLEDFASQGEIASEDVTLRHRDFHPSLFNIDDLEANSICVALGLGQYSFHISLDNSCLQSGDEALFERLTRRVRSLSRWRCEVFFLLAWLTHVCLAWNLRALEASQGQGPSRQAGD